MDRNRRWSRLLLPAFAGCLSITVALPGISQHHQPADAEAQGGDPRQAAEADAPRHPHRAAGGSGLHHDFSDAEHWTAVFDSDERSEWQKPEEVVALMEIRPGMIVADLGAGTGFFLGHLAAAVGGDGRVLALEPEPNLVAFIERRADRHGWDNVEARRIPYDDPEIEDGSLDRVLIVNTWHHIDSRVSYAAKLRRALKPGGSVFVVDFTLDSPSGPPKEHRLPPEQILRELEAGGLQARQIEETLPRQFTVVGSREPVGE